MGKKKGGGSSSNNNTNDNDAVTTRHETPLQAVLLAADWHDNNGSRTAFRPLTLQHHPTMLVPLHNVPLIDYALDYLAGQGVAHVVVVCTQTEVQTHLEASCRSDGSGSGNGSGSNDEDAATALWSNSVMQLTILKDASLTNEGDALRELDRRDWIQSDPFVLMHGNTVTNIPLAPILHAHKARRAVDRANIMTLLFQNAGRHLDGQSAAAASSAVRDAAQDLIVAVDPTRENRIVYYKSSRGSAEMAMPCSFFASHAAVAVHAGDWTDIGLDICSPDLLARFTDEFDYKSLRRPFATHAAAEEEEGLQTNKMHAHVMPTTSYAANVTSPASYHAVARDLLQRWCPAAAPDRIGRGLVLASGGCNRKEEEGLYSMDRHYVYRPHISKHGIHSAAAAAAAIQDPKSVVDADKAATPTAIARVGRTARIKGPALLGPGATVGEDCRLTGTVVLGRNVHVADGVVLRDTHLWDNVDVRAGVTVENSIVADGCVLLEGSTVSKGCLLGAGCVVGKGVTLPPFTRLTALSVDAQAAAEKEEDDDDDDDGWGSDSDDEDEDEEEEEDDDAEEGAKTTATTTAALVSDVDVVGPDGVGRVWLPTPRDEDEEEDDVEWYGMTAQQRLLAQSMGYDPTPLYQERRVLQEEDWHDGFSDEEPDDISAQDHAGYPSSGDELDFDRGTSGGSGMEKVVGRQEGVDVVQELKNICLEYESTSPIENLAIELNSYKFSQNATYADCTMAATLAILQRMEIVDDIKDTKLIVDFKQHLEEWCPLLQKMSIGLDEEKAIVLALEVSATGLAGSKQDEEQDVKYKQIVAGVLGSGMSFRLLLQTLHDEEVVSEEAILSWAAERRQEAEERPDSPRSKLFSGQPVQDFLDWLEEEDSEDDDDDESGEEDSEEED